MDKTTKTIVAIAVALIVIIGGYFVYKDSSQPASTEPIKIGAILPLTGDLATYGEGIKNAANLAIENSGMKDKIQIIFEDDQTCTPTNDVSAAQKLINLDKVNGIVGPICSGSTLAVAPITEQNKLTIISPVATSKSITNAGNYIFRTIASDADKSIAVTKYAYKKGYKKAALFYDAAQDAMVQQKADTKETFVGLGGAIVADQSYKTGDKDFRTQLTKIKQSDADVIFIGGVPKEAALAIKQARELGIKLPFIATETSLGTQDVIDVAGSAADGLVFPFSTTPDNKESKDFIADYKAKYGQEPPAYAAEGYDATMLLIKAIAKSDRTPEDIQKQLFKVGNNYYGASGLITFDKNGDVQKPMIIKMIKNDQFINAD